MYRNEDKLVRICKWEINLLEAKYVTLEFSLSLSIAYQSIEV